MSSAAQLRAHLDLPRTNSSVVAAAPPKRYTSVLAIPAQLPAVGPASADRRQVAGRRGARLLGHRSRLTTDTAWWQEAITAAELGRLLAPRLPPLFL